MIGSRIDRYEIVAKLGEGGMGEVYRAIDTTLGREIALKILPPEMAADTGRLARFHREARAAAALNHPNVATLFSVEESGGVHFHRHLLARRDPLRTTHRQSPDPGQVADGTGGLDSIIEEQGGKQAPDLTDDQWDHGSSDGDIYAVIK